MHNSIIPISLNYRTGIVIPSQKLKKIDQVDFPCSEDIPTTMPH